MERRWKSDRELVSGTDILDMSGVDPFDIQTIRNSGDKRDLPDSDWDFHDDSRLYQQLTTADVLVANGAFMVGSTAMTILMGRWCWAIPGTMIFTVTP